jgi:type IV secretion system protein VirB5
MNGTAFTQDDRNLEMADTIDGLAQKNARMWRLIALVSLSSFFIALGVLIYAVTLPETVPVMVTINPEGEAAYVGKIDK